MMCKVLLVDDDVVSLDLNRRLLTFDGHDVQGAPTGRGALDVALVYRPDVALIDLRLPDMSGLDVLRALKERMRVECAIVTGYGTVPTTVHAIQLGAADVIEKPVVGEALSALVARLADQRRPGAVSPLQPVEAHAAGRWAQLIVRTIDLPSDPRTLSEWGRALGASQGALRNWCRTARIPARRSLLFARLLRAFLHQQRTGMALENLLNVFDRRTLAKLLAAAGATERPGSVEEFIENQTLVSDDVAVAQVARLLGIVSTRTPPTAEPSSDATVDTPIVDRRLERRCQDLN
jgi:DNA-binding response OmpR family regulator